MDLTPKLTPKSKLAAAVAGVGAGVAEAHLPNLSAITGDYHRPAESAERAKNFHDFRRITEPWTHWTETEERSPTRTRTHTWGKTDKTDISDISDLGRPRLLREDTQGASLINRADHGVANIAPSTHRAIINQATTPLFAKTILLLKILTYLYALLSRVKFANNSKTRIFQLLSETCRQAQHSNTTLALASALLHRMPRQRSMRENNISATAF
jgi:hypothetical protein